MRRCSTCGVQYPLDFLVCPKDATALDRVEGGDDDPMLGEVLAGTFCVTKLLGEGGMGRVYEAEHVRLPRRFAVKVMHESLSSNPEAVARFEREAQAVAKVGSDHVLEIVDVIRVRDGRPCLVSELLEGEELGNLLDRAGKLPLSTSITICRQVCRGLAAAHAVGVVHRDLKPSNLYVCNREYGAIHVKILDFGVAKMTDGADITRTGMVVGTPAYMAPEQARGSADVDVRADVYAVGAVLYRLLTGSPPFSEADPALTLTKLLTEDPKRPRDLDRNIPEGVELLIQRAMARSPTDRPSSALELDRQLGAFDETRMSMPAIQSRQDSYPMQHSETISVDVITDGREAEDATKRARRARPAAVMLAGGTALAAGGAVLATAGGALRGVSGRMSLTDVELMLVSVMAGLAALLVVVGALRALAARWRSAPSVERLAGGMRAALITLLASIGVTALLWRGYNTLAPPLDAQLLSTIDVALVGLPTLLGAVVFAFALKRASRVH
jgi:serine/threonine-protein kinase